MTAPDGFFGERGDEFYLSALTPYDGPVTVAAWGCKTCGAVVPASAVELHKERCNTVSALIAKAEKTSGPR